MNLRHLACLAFLLVSACTEYPRDPNGTLPRVRAEKSFKVGLISPIQSDPSAPAVQALIGRIANATRASPRTEQGDTERLLKRLEAGELDLVVGRFEKKSPWATLVTIGEPLVLEKEGKAKFQIAPAMQNGENAWIALVERESRQVARVPA